MKTTIGVLGTGKIAAPMVRSLVRRFNDVRIVLSPRSIDNSRKLAQRYDGVSVADDNQHVVDQADTVLLCLLADVAREVLPSLRFRPSQRLLSVMIDYSVEQLRHDCAPVTQVELTMPLPFIEFGQCPLPCYPSAEIVNELYGDDNPITVLTASEEMQPYIAVSGVVSGLMQSFDAVSGWLAEVNGDPAAAESHVVGVLAGYLSTLPRDGQSRFKDVMRDLSTTGGLNAQFRQGLDDAGVYRNIHHQLSQLLSRLES